MGAEVFDLASASSAGAATGALRQLNQRLHDLTEETAKTPWRILHPRGAHAVAAGVDAPVEIDIEGHVGYYCAGMNQRAHINRPRDGGGRGGREYDVGGGESEGPRQPVRWGHWARRPAGH